MSATQRIKQVRVQDMGAQQATLTRLLRSTRDGMGQALQITHSLQPILATGYNRIEIKPGEYLRSSMSPSKFFTTWYGGQSSPLQKSGFSA